MSAKVDNSLLDVSMVPSTPVKNKHERKFIAILNH